MPITHDIDYSQVAKQTARIEAARRTALQALLINVRAVGELEEKLGIAETWTEAHPDYISTMQYMRSHKFRRVLDNLQRLVVQRLFELSKANMAGTGISSLCFNDAIIFIKCQVISSVYTLARQSRHVARPSSPLSQNTTSSHHQWNLLHPISSGMTL